MGTYTYKVTSKRVKLVDGSEANVAVFAFKPHFWDDKLNGRMYFQSRCGAAERLVSGRNYTGKIVMGHVEDDGKIVVGSTVAKKCSRGVFDDCEFERMEDAGIPA